MCPMLEKDVGRTKLKYVEVKLENMEVDYCRRDQRHRYLGMGYTTREQMLGTPCQAGKEVHVSEQGGPGDSLDLLSERCELQRTL